MRARPGVLAAAVATAALAALAVPGCDLGTSKPSSTISPCFRALPAASRAAEPHGRLVSVRRTTGPRVDAALARIAPDHPAITADGSVCVVAYKSVVTTPPSGATTTGSTAPLPQPYIVVVIDEHKLTLVQVVRVDHLPQPMRHR